LPSEDVLRQQVLERVIIDKLQLQLAAINNIQVDDETLTSNLRNIAEQNKMDLDQFRTVLEREGQNYASFREEIRNQIILARLHQQMVGSRINITEQEIDNLLANEKTWGGSEKEYHLAHILIAVPEGASPEQIKTAQLKAQETVDKLRSGTDFAATAVAVSAGQTALEGGDLGWRKAGQLPAVLTDAIIGMQTGQISDPIRASGGFHIVKLLELRGDGRHVITQTHVRHILLTADDVLPENEVRIRLEQLRDRIIGGEDFAQLARSHSKDKVSASKGGDLGWVGPGDLVPQFEETMNQLKPKEISQPVQTRFGWHIIQVQERRDHDSTDEFKRNKARELIRKRKNDEELALWLRRLRDEAYVEYRNAE
jgi:peptidyl-prolyl cis-trans isomerase SurA